MKTSTMVLLGVGGLAAVLIGYKILNAPAEGGVVTDKTTVLLPPVTSAVQVGNRWGVPQLPEAQKPTQNPWTMPIANLNQKG